MLGFNKKTQDASPQENTGGENKVFHFIKTHKKRCIAVVAAAAVLVAVIVPRRSRSASADLAYTQEKLGRRDIVNVYDGSGTINAADSYTVKSLVTGTVLTADFELGDSIEKGDILYTIDISDVENNLASAQLSVEQAQRNYDDAADMQNVRTRISGEVSSFAVAAGDAVQAGQTVATIRDTSVMLLAVDFPAAEAQSFVAGQAAQVMPDTTFETLNGTIRSVSGANPAGDSSLMTCTVTIAVPNAGSLTTAQAAVAQVNGVSSLNSAHFTYQREETVAAAASGTVSELCVKEGSTVRQGDVILRITGKDLDKQTKNAADNLRSAELQMSSAEKTISHYTIDAPISGTIVDKKVKAGDKLSANDTAMQNLCTIYDMSHLEMKLNVDELKIRSLKGRRRWTSPPTPSRVRLTRASSAASSWQALPPTAPPATRHRPHRRHGRAAARNECHCEDHHRQRQECSGPAQRRPRPGQLCAGDQGFAQRCQCGDFHDRSRRLRLRQGDHRHQR